MKILNTLIFLANLYLVNCGGTYEFPSAPVVAMKRPYTELIKPPTHDKGVEEHKEDNNHDAAYKFQEVSHSSPLDGTEKIIKEDAEDDSQNSKYNFVATDKEIIPGIKESAVAEDSEDSEHSSYYKYHAYDREIPALFKTYYPVYYPAYPMVPSMGYGGNYKTPFVGSGNILLGYGNGNNFGKMYPNIGGNGYGAFPVPLNDAYGSYPKTNGYSSFPDSGYGSYPLDSFPSLNYFPYESASSYKPSSQKIIIGKDNGYYKND